MPVESAYIETFCPSLLLILTYKLAELEAIQFFKCIIDLVTLKRRNNNGCFKKSHYNI